MTHREGDDALTRPPARNSYDFVGYNLSASCTGRQVSPSTQIPYLGGAIVGPGVEDAFRVGDVTWNQTFLNVHQSSWAQSPADGFLGLSFDSIAENATHTVPATMLAEGILAEPRFGLYYGTEFYDTAGQPGDGVLTFGASHEDRYVDGEMLWVPVIKGGDPADYQLWRGSIVGFQGSYTGGDGQPVTDGREYYDWAKASGVFDTGAGSISVPELDARLMYTSIGWDLDKIMSHEHIPLCTEFNSSWSMTFNFEGDAPGDLRNLTVTGDMLARPGYANRADACTPPFEPGNGDGFFLFGVPLLFPMYTVYDFGASKEADFKPRVGFGHLKEEFKAPFKAPPM